MNKKIYIGIFIFLCISIFLYTQTTQAPQEKSLYKKIDITIGATKIRADIADTPALQTQGLSGRKELKENEGMLFIFPEEGPRSFWMKDMNFPIDIIWANKEYEIIDITHSLATSTYPNAVSPQKPAQYVLEMPAGFAEKNRIVIGEKLSPRQ